ncbi:MAG: helix-turn-helix domain-containing protein [Candidatus Thiodiazotropha endolucinida]
MKKKRKSPRFAGISLEASQSQAPNNISYYRYKHDMQGEKLAALTGLKTDLIYKLERGKAPLTQERLDKISDALGVKPRDLINKNTKMHSKERKPPTVNFQITEDDRKLPNNIRALRKQKRLSLVALAKLAAVSVPTIHNLEFGKVNLTPAWKQKLEKLLGGTIEGEIKEERPSKPGMPGYAPEEMPNNIRALRRSRNISAQSLAKACGVHLGTIYEWERDKAVFSDEALKKLSAALSCQPPDIA